MLKKTNNIFSRMRGRLTIKSMQKSFEYEGHTLHYLFQPAKSDALIVSFSSFPGKFRRAHYNYIRTLDGFPANRLFILDNFGWHKRGSYYLGENGDFFVERAVISLIDQISERNSISNRIFIGTSKGGWAALYFGMKYDCSCIVSGAPQYLLGSYLNYKKHLKYLRRIMGNTSQKSVGYLDSLLRDAVAACTEKRKVFLHFSTCEHTYAEHIKYLLEDLQKKPNCKLFTDICSYTEHGKVADFFPQYIKKVISDEIGERA